MLLCHGGREAQATRDPPTTVAPAPGFSALVSPLGKLRGRRLSCDQEEGAGSEDLALPGPPPGCAPPGPWVPGPGLCGSQGHRPPAPAVSGRGSPGGWVGPVGRGPRSEAVFWLWAPRKWGLPLGVGWESCPPPGCSSSRDWPPRISQHLPSWGASRDTGQGVHHPRAQFRTEQHVRGWRAEISGVGR